LTIYTTFGTLSRRKTVLDAPPESARRVLFREGRRRFRKPDAALRPSRKRAAGALAAGAGHTREARNTVDPDPDRDLDIARARAQLAGSPVGHTIVYRALTTSTMADARALAASGAVALAGAQSEGRGRMARRWEAPAGTALLLSVLLRGAHIPAQPGLLPAAAGLAVLEAIAAVAPLPVGLKWPNDVLAGRDPAQARKMAGILAESSLAGPVPDYAVLGIGVNVNQATGDLPQVDPPAPPPTSLALELGLPVDRTALLVALCRALDRTLALPPSELLAAWRAQLWTLGRPVTVYLPGAEPLHGRAVDVAADGALVVEAGGQRHAVYAGDVSLRSS
jgi:BirA family biotin operon repressor/biotin-[acetyl-CoA-carboxylase] ligase